MATRVDRNVEWIKDDNGDVAGYQRRPGDVVPIVRIDPATGAAVAERLVIAGAIDFRRFSPPTDGTTDCTSKWLSACAEAVGLGVAILLPPYPIVVSQTSAIDKIIGTPGKSKVKLAPDFTLTGYGAQFAFLNPNFGLAFNGAADDVAYFGFDVELNPNAHLGVFGLANVRGGFFDQVRIRANQVIKGGKPVAVDSLIDIYSACKNLYVDRCTLENLTDAYGATKVAENGGGCVWVRDFKSSAGSVTEDNCTENIWITRNVIRHKTSDEAVAVYGCNGITRSVHVVGNNIIGLDSTAYHSALISAFPLDLGLGTSQVYDVEITGNKINDRGWLYNVMRFGNSTDASRACYNIKSRGNLITAFRSSDATTGPKATWTAAGSPGSDPDIASIVMRNIIGNQGSGFPSSFQGNTSTDDQIYCPVGGSQVNTAISSFDLVSGVHIQGNIYTGIASCNNVSGGLVNAYGRAFYNNASVVGSRYKVDGYVAADFDGSTAGRFKFADTIGISAGGFVSVSGTGAHRVLVTGNMGSMGGGTALNNTNASASITARLNDVSGTVAAIAVGTVTRTLNNWSGTTD